MRRETKLTTALWLTAALLAAAGCSAPTANAPSPNTNAPSPPATPAAAEQDPFEAIEKLAESIQGSDPAVGSARDECLARQRSRLESCRARSGQQRLICEAVARELITVCEQMNPKAPAFLAGLLFCSGDCPSRKCNPVCPAPGGGQCLGSVCTTPGAVCDPGFFWSCKCKTTVVGPPLMQAKVCSCSCV